MFRDLRKGNTYIEIISGEYYETIDSKETKLFFKNNKLIISTTLNPVDKNQKDNIEYILIKNVNLPDKVIFRDKIIKEKIESFFISYQKDIKNLELQIKYDKIYQFEITITPIENGLALINRK